MIDGRVSIPHVRALDGLRGAAVTGVLLYHGDQLKGGYLGVDLFFVLSGFLITSLLFAELRNSDRVALGTFWARRARRLLPALVVLLLGVAVYCVVFAAPIELGRIRFDALATLAYVANWRSIASHQSYFDLFTAPSPLQHTWSLAIEEQFYLLWPLIFVGLAKWWRQRTAQAVLATAMLLGAGSAALMFGLYDKANTNRVYFGTDTRSFALFAGIAIAAAVTIFGHANVRSSRILLEISGLSSLLILILMWLTVEGQAPLLYRGGFVLAGVAAALVIAAAANPRRGPIGWVLSFPPLCWLGLVSYGLYLWHWPVDVVLTANRVGITGWPLFAVRTTVALVIALTSFHLVEMPIRRGALRPRQWRFAIPVVSVALVLALLVVTAGAIDTRPHNSSSPPGLPSGRQPSHRLLLLGDSVADSLWPGLARANFPPVSIWWFPGCRWIYGPLRFQDTFTPNCLWAYAFDYTMLTFRPDRVIFLMGAWDLFAVRPVGSSTFAIPGSPKWNAAFRASLDIGITIARRHGAAVTFLTIPCTSRDAFDNEKTNGDPGPTDIRRVRAANRIIEETAKANPGTVTAVDLYGFLCSGDRYHTKVRGIATRYDGIHLSDAGADLVARWLRTKINLHTVNRHGAVATDVPRV